MVKSVDRVIRILQAVSQQQNGLTHKEMAEALSIPKGSLTPIISDLLEAAYLSTDGDSKRYILGPRLLILAGRFLMGQNIVQIGQTFVSKLARTTDESSSMAIRNGLEQVIVCQENSTQALLGAMNIGESRPIYATAAGKAILAFLPEEEIEDYISKAEFVRYTATTITDPDAFREDLAKTRERGLAYCREELQEGHVVVGAPVFDVSGRVVASLAIGTPTIRFTPEKEELIKETLLSVSRSLSRRLGFDIKSRKS